MRQTNAQLAAALEKASAQVCELRLRLEEACQDRDRVSQRLSSCAAESASYKHQRDEAVEALADLLVCVDCLTGDVPDASRVAVVSALQDLHPTADAARALLERYRPSRAGTSPLRIAHIDSVDVPTGTTSRRLVSPEAHTTG